jgi:hypothetical protein
MNKSTLEQGDIMQLSPFDTRNKAFAGCLFIVSEPKAFGAQGYVQGLGDDRETPAGQAYYRAHWDEMEPTGGKAVWVAYSQQEQE